MEAVYENFTDFKLRYTKKFNINENLDDLLTKIITIQKTFEEIQNGLFENLEDTRAFCGQLRTEIKSFRNHVNVDWESVNNFSPEEKVNFLGMENPEIIKNIHSFVLTILSKKGQTEGLFLYSKNNLEVLKKIIWAFNLIIENIENFLEQEMETKHKKIEFLEGF